MKGEVHDLPSPHSKNSFGPWSSALLQRNLATKLTWMKRHLVAVRFQGFFRPHSAPTNH